MKNISMRQFADFVRDYKNKVSDGSIVNENKNKVLKKELGNFHYADIADLIKQVSLDEAVYMVKLLENDIDLDKMFKKSENYSGFSNLKKNDKKRA